MDKHVQKYKQTHFRDQFVSSHYIHLNNAAMGPMSLAAQAAIRDYHQLLTEQGSHALPILQARYQQARQNFAQLVGAASEDIAMMPTTSVAISQVAMGMHWRSGDEIVLWEDEYPSNIYPWLAAARQYHLKIVWVKPPQNYQLDTAWLIDAITPRTRVVAVSWVQYRTGAMVDLLALSAAARKVGAWLVVDAIQGVGVIPFDLQAMGVDAVCMGTWKWLCAGSGYGFLALAPGHAEQLNPIMHGAMTYGELYEPIDKTVTPKSGARKFEPGSPNYIGALAASAAARLALDVGVAQLNQDALVLSQHLKNELQDKCATILGNLDSQSPIVTFIPPGDATVLSQRLTKQSISHTPRDNSIRIAPHAFNTLDEIDQVLALL